MNARRIERFLANPACKAAGTMTPALARDFCFRCRGCPTPKLRLCDDGAIRLLWRRNGREVKVFVRANDVSLSVHSSVKDDEVPPRIATAMTVQKAMRAGLKWLSSEA